MTLWEARRRGLTFGIRREGERLRFDFEWPSGRHSYLAEPGDLKAILTGIPFHRENHNATCMIELVGEAVAITVREAGGQERALAFSRLELWQVLIRVTGWTDGSVR